MVCLFCWILDLFDGDIIFVSDSRIWLARASSRWLKVQSHDIKSGSEYQGLKEVYIYDITEASG